MTITEQVIKQGSATKLNADANNCTVLSFAAATNIPYDQAYSIAQDKWSRVKGKGITTSVLSRFFGEDNINVCDNNILICLCSSPETVLWPKALANSILPASPCSK